jgi:hypothetical protein
VFRSNGPAHDASRWLLGLEPRRTQSEKPPRVVVRDRERAEWDQRRDYNESECEQDALPLTRGYRHVPESGTTNDILPIGTCAARRRQQPIQLPGHQHFDLDHFSTSCSERRNV